MKCLLDNWMWLCYSWVMTIGLAMTEELLASIVHGGMRLVSG